jgi:predicted transcriptional regulator
MSDDNTIRVKDVMTPEVRTIAGTATVAEAVDLMRAAGVSSIVVERRDGDDEFGMIVVSDIAAEVIAKGRAADRVNVYEVMTKPVLSVSTDMNIKYAIRMLVQFGLSRALVVNESRTPTGIVTLRDMVLRHGEHD